MNENKNYQKITIFGIANFGDDCVFPILAKILFPPVFLREEKKILVCTHKTFEERKKTLMIFS